MNLKKVFGVIGRIVFIFLLGSIIVSANMSIKNSDNIKMVNNEDKIKKEKVKMEDDTLLENEQMCTSTEIDTSESTSIRVHPVTGEIRVEDKSETFITDENFLIKNNNSEEQEAIVMCTEIAVQDDITKIIVTNGNTGEKKEINSIEEVDRILNQIRSMTVISQ